MDGGVDRDTDKDAVSVPYETDRNRDRYRHLADMDSISDFSYPIKSLFNLGIYSSIYLFDIYLTIFLTIYL
jgi:hypothetical protein